MKILLSPYFLLVSIFTWLFPADQTPDWTRFTKVTLATGLDEPMEMAFMPNSKVIIVERKGGVKIVDEKDGSILDAGFIKVNTKYTNKKGQSREAEEGLMGVSLDPNFVKNHWVYLYYAHPTITKHVLSRFVLKGDTLNMSTEKVVMEVPTQREECCHTGGGMVWDKSGNLFLTTGNNTVNPPQGSSNLTEIPGEEPKDDQRAPGNTNDLRGKILRIHPEPNGTYTIPKGNLFAVGTPKTKPEIYTMGHRNAWRPTLDSKTGYLYWGEVGPDAQKDSTWGPRGYDEFNQAKGPGFFGWPYFIANNKPYRKYDSQTGKYGEVFDVNKPQNLSINNTGLIDLPKPVPAYLYYPYGKSEEFPLLGTSGRSATGGPVFHKTDFVGAKRVWPSYFENKWLITDFMRGWIIAVTMDANSDYQSMERVLPDMNFSSAIDMDFGPSGDLYVLEYGSAWFRGNANSKLVRIEYNAGNRKPLAAAKLSQESGSVPLMVSLDATESTDLDPNDIKTLKHEWQIKNAKGLLVKTLTGVNPSFNFIQAGNYVVSYTVTDIKGARNTQKFNVSAGNASPEIDIVLSSTNKSFYFGNELNYEVKIKDKEDGELKSGIEENEVSVTFDYLPAGFDPIEIAAKQKSTDDLASFAVGKNLIEKSDCKSCHQYATKSIGPSYVDVAAKYPNSADNMKYLVKKIKEGGSGVWGEHGMSAHPTMPDIDAKRMVDFIFSLKDGPALKRIGTTGNIALSKPDYETGLPNYVLRAAYKDKGNKSIKPILSEKIIYLRSNTLKPQDFGKVSAIQLITTPGYSFSPLGQGAYGTFYKVDLTGIKELLINIQTAMRGGGSGGIIEVRVGGPQGQLLGTSSFIGASDNAQVRPPEGMTQAEFARTRSNKFKVPLIETTGFKDICLVFKNDKAKATDILFQLNDVTFNQ